MSSSTPTASLRDLTTTLTLVDIVLITSLTALILITILGNTLIIAAVATTRRLRTVTNYFVVSLAASDLLVGLLVMPFAVVKEVTDGLWLFGQVACELWVSMDVMLCTASILNLCCISVDRYLAITHPLNYAVMRSTRSARNMIGAVWFVSATITCPPIFGWHDRSQSQNDTKCAYIGNVGYVIFSALGSFYIPAIIMVYVYWRIFAVARKRQAVLMQEGEATNNRENHGSDSNSSTVGDTPTQNADQQRILKLPEEGVPTEENVQMSKVRKSSTRRQSGRRKSSFSLIRSVPFLLSRQNTYNSKITTKLYHQQNHHHDHDNHHQAAAHEEWEQSPDDSVAASTSKKLDSPVASSPTGGQQYCPYCNPKKDSGSQKTKRLTIRKKDGYERAAFQRERRVAKSLSIVVGGFIICWLPFFTVYLIEPFCDSCFFHPTLSACLVWLGWVNSAINPFIYAFNSKDFKTAFIRLTIDKCRCCRKTRKGHDPQQFI